MKHLKRFNEDQENGYPPGYLDNNPHAPSEETMRKMMSLHDPEDFESNGDGEIQIAIHLESKAKQPK